ncbi:MAG: hypothetical protein IJ572_04840 [Bacilli bacterium]|nr:hypothetical protein [Bacilli bacterium]
MKIKIILLIIISSFTIYIIYNRYYEKTINITSINSLNDQENYNKFLSEYLSNTKLNYKLNIDFTNKDLEIENLLAIIQNNEGQIQSILHDSEIIILSIGNIDYKTEDLKTIINEINKLFKLIRNLNNKQVFFVSPYKIKNTTQIKELCHKYNIIFLNGSSFQNKSFLLAQLLTKKIANSWEK